MDYLVHFVGDPDLRQGFSAVVSWFVVFVCSYCEEIIQGLCNEKMRNWILL